MTGSGLRPLIVASALATVAFAISAALSVTGLALFVVVIGVGALAGAALRTAIAGPLTLAAAILLLGARVRPSPIGRHVFPALIDPGADTSLIPGEHARLARISYSHTASAHDLTQRRRLSSPASR